MKIRMTTPRLSSFPFTARRGGSSDRGMGVKPSDRSRRDFLAWLGAGAATAAVGCVAPSSDEQDAANGAVDASGASGGESPTGEVTAETEEDLTTCKITTRDAKGPYFEPGAPIRSNLRIADLDEPGVRLGVEGRVLGPSCLTPLAGYTLDVWQADASGNYYAGAGNAYRLRGKIKTDALGRYRFETILPGRYGDDAGIRPAHLHVSFLSPGGNVILTTQIYFAGDPYLGQADYCTRSGTCNSSDPNRILKLRNGFLSNVAGKLSTFNVVLPRT